MNCHHSQVWVATSLLKDREWRSASPFTVARWLAGWRSRCPQNFLKKHLPVREVLSMSNTCEKEVKERRCQWEREVRRRLGFMRFTEVKWLEIKARVAFIRSGSIRTRWLTSDDLTIVHWPSAANVRWSNHQTLVSGQCDRRTLDSQRKRLVVWPRNITKFGILKIGILFLKIF